MEANHSKKTRNNAILYSVQKVESRFIILRKREILLIDLPPFIDVGMQVNFRGLYRGMSKVFLHNSQVF